MTSADPERSVTIVSQAFHPDTSANAGVLTELATGLAARGISVDVLAAQPTYTDEDRASTEPWTERYEGVHVRRLPTTRFDRNRGIAYRMMNELSFFVVAFCYLLGRRVRGAELLLLPTAPTFLPILGWLLQPLGYQSVPIVMDLYPDMAVELGYLSETGLVYRVWSWLNRRTYPTVTRVVTIGETMETTLRDKYGTECNVTVIHNWADGDFITPQSKSENPFAETHDLSDELTVLYSGNLGQHHDLESVMKAAIELDGDDVQPRPHFVFIGEGGKKPKLKEMASEHALDTVTFLPYQPVDKLPNSLTAGDVSVVTMEQGVEGLCVSSKFYTALASGTAILAISTSNGEIGTVVERTGCGIRVNPNRPEQVADAIRYWTEQPDEIEKMGYRAREVFENEFSEAQALDKYEHIVSELSID